MLFKSAVFAGLLPLCLAAIDIKNLSAACKIKLVNVGSQTSLRSYYCPDPVFLPVVQGDTDDDSGANLFRIFPAENNLFYITGVVDNAFMAVQTGGNGSIITSRDPTTWTINQVTNNSYTIGVPYKDLVWTPSPPQYYERTIHVESPTGSLEQEWYLNQECES